MSVIRWLFEPRRPGQRMQIGVLCVGATLVVGFLLLSWRFSANQAATASAKASVFVTAFALFLVSAAAGMLAGFVFGLPRSRLADQLASGSQSTAAPGPAHGPDGSAPQAVPASTAYLTNSNLTKVSDWLTTIVVGLGLVNLGKVAPAVRDLGAALEEPLGGSPQAGLFGVSTVLTGLAAGFVLTFLWTTLQYRSLLEDNERFVDVPDLRATSTTVGEAKRRIEKAGLRARPIPADAMDDQLVAFQLPDAGSRAAPGDAVLVVVTETRSDLDPG
jgi:hypothetical protein